MNSSQTLDVHDSEVKLIGELLADLQRRSAGMSTKAWERMAHERFAEIGFKITIDWYDTNVEKVFIPEINIVDRVVKDFVFDRDRQVHEVTSNLLGIPGEEGVIKTDKVEMDRLMGEKKDHGDC